MFETSKSGDRFAEKELIFSPATKPCSHFRCLAIEELSSVKRAATILLNSSQVYQKIIGFGGAFTDSAGLNLRALQKSLQIRVISDYFSESGIEYTLGRIPIGGSDFSTRPYTYDDVEGDFGLEHFALTPEDLDYKVKLKFNSIIFEYQSIEYPFRFHTYYWLKN